MMSIGQSIWALPADLQDEARRSLGVPQFGSHHNEGPFLSYHLELIFETIEDVEMGDFHHKIVPALREILRKSAVLRSDLVPMYVLLHDIDKGNCMTIVFQDGDKLAVTWDDWLAWCKATNKAELDAFCQKEEIRQISYYQEKGEFTRSHGKVTAHRLRGRTDIDPLVVKAIEIHEIAFQFGAKGGVNLPLFIKTFAGWTDEEVHFGLLVNYADQMGSLGPMGVSDISDFLWLGKTYLAKRQYEELERMFQMPNTLNLDRAKVTKALETLFKSADAFQNESVDQAYSRILRECAIPTYDEVKLRNELGMLVASGAIDAPLADQLTSVLMTAGLVPSDIGKQLGKANKDVRVAIARAVVAST